MSCWRYSPVFGFHLPVMYSSSLLQVSIRVSVPAFKSSLKSLTSSFTSPLPSRFKSSQSRVGNTVISSFATCRYGFQPPCIKVFYSVSNPYLQVESEVATFKTQVELLAWLKSDSSRQQCHHLTPSNILRTIVYVVSSRLSICGPSLALSRKSTPASRLCCTLILLVGYLPTCPKCIYAADYPQL